MEQGNSAPAVDPFGLAGKVAMVVGGSGGIGLGIARRLQAYGASVQITGTRQKASAYDDPLDGLAYHSLDATNDAAVAALAATAEPPAILVYSGGTVAYQRAEYDIRTFRRIVEVNLNGAMSCATSFHPALARSGHGAVLLLGSTSSFIATPGQPAYGASKGALVTLVKSLARAWAGDGIRVNGLAPGLVATKLTAISRDDVMTFRL